MKKALLLIVLFILSITIIFTLLYTNFPNIIEHKEDSIKAISKRDSGNGVLYYTTDTELINELISIMNSSNYIRRITAPSAVGNSPIILYDDKNKELAQIQFYKSNIVAIDNKSYKVIGIKDNSLKEFYRKFMVDTNIKNGL